MYRPNFCAECGVRIERTHWHLWTNRKFCDTCVKSFQRANLLKCSVAVLSLLIIGFLAGRATSNRTTADANPLVITRSEAMMAQVPTKNEARDVSPSANNQTINSGEVKLKKMHDGKFAETPPEADELVSICGARTLKGTPCQRRVRGTGHRCWQHLGKPAMLPPEKLVVQGKLP